LKRPGRIPIATKHSYVLGNFTSEEDFERAAAAQEAAEVKAAAPEEGD
jgi:hypothetical protein